MGLGKKMKHGNIINVITSGNPIGKDLGTLDHIHLEVSILNFLVNLIPKIFDVSRIGALGRARVP